MTQNCIPGNSNDTNGKVPLSRQSMYSLWYRDRTAVKVPAMQHQAGRGGVIVEQVRKGVQSAIVTK